MTPTSKWGLGKRAVQDDADAKPIKDSTGGAEDYKLFNPDVAAALGYGKNFSATYQWWVTVVCLLVAVGGYITWLVGLFKSADETDKAFSALRLKSDWWQIGRQLMIMTAVVYPILTLLAVAVSGWRGWLAKQLGSVPVGGHDAAALARWRRRSKRWQGVTIGSTVLLWLLLFFLLFSFAGLCVWAGTTIAVSSAGEVALSPIASTWERLVGIATQSQGLVDDFINSLARLPAIGRRRVLSEVDRIVAAGADTPSTSGDELAAAIAAGVAAQRSLQQLPSLSDGLNGLLQGAQTAITAARQGAAPAVSNALGNLTAALNATGLNNVLPTLLPSGADNPLFQAVSTLRDRVGRDIFNATGCPVYCIDLRSLSVLEDGCLCNMDRLRDSLPHFKAAGASFGPAIVGAVLMWLAASWLLMHAASMWGRTSTEGRLLQQSQQHSTAAAAAAAAGSAQSLPPASHAV